MIKNDTRFKALLKGMERIAFGYMQRVARHSHQELINSKPNPHAFELNEQIDKHTGAMTSVENLLWNYANQLFIVKLLLDLESQF